MGRVNVGFAMLAIRSSDVGIRLRQFTNRPAEIWFGTGKVLSALQCRYCLLPGSLAVLSGADSSHSQGNEVHFETATHSGEFRVSDAHCGL